MPIIRQRRRDINAANQITPGTFHNVDVDWASMLWGAITVGRRSWFDVVRFGPASLMEIVWRCAMVRANIQTHLSEGTTHFRTTSAFNSLDGSEKGAVTYFLGLILAKLAAEDLLSVPWVLHLDVYSKINAHGNMVAVTTTQGMKSRPDLIGRAVSGDWLVCEAKGRTTSITNDQRILAKEQTRQISTINGVAPNARYASFASFSGGARNLVHEWIDPAGSSETAEPLELPEPDFIKSYYRTISDFLRFDNPAVLDRPYEKDGLFLGRVPGMDLWIGLDPEHPSAWMRYDLGTDDPDFAPRILERAAKYEPPKQAPGRKIGLDGIAVVLGESWL
ncbi:hypothetical protein [Sinorhizobium meliloti]|uniref:hypothetical protein n=1 Tax=Rhizobium meliloti TaxID=382 RepID=UPI000FD92C04|nr:hypothetical protein [Sinorhizobium meliloti]MQX70798.1 hypothetical protein [Sinorhizobium meliloti]RVG79137.1 hypothetical protein CN219_27010 [Sinorhizobium meliloti]RVI35210.1 hypothetical protein CN197_14365 [Sinorhizobium meliloti]RVI39963.1 hypothetical protein CN196_30035 [Sinorhizobium meliloti]RVJ20079.1 hypothetical protein CN177_24360 [Sinorhizobium meliloti]